jgi:hypothetical protein
MIAILRGGEALSIHEIVKRMDVKNELEMRMLVSRQLKNLEMYGLVRKEFYKFDNVEKWRWIG